ncbi:MAG: hypothetical protein K6E20_01180 [Acholeplasmatales bacterium]|nr:hypothetical protein [Acholeplasmatales bacterium]
MFKGTKKIVMSIVMMIVSALAMVVTTFAWVGITSNNTFERITINLETDNEKSDYGIMLSLTGDANDFHETIDTVDLQRQLLVNMGYDKDSLESDSTVQNVFSRIKLAQCTTVKDYDDGGTGECVYLDPFLTLEGNTPYANMNNRTTRYKGYFEFDIWVSLYRIGGSSSSDNRLSIYLRNGDAGGLFSSSTTTSYIANEIKFPGADVPGALNYLSNENNFGPGKSIQGDVSINAASAVRLSVQKAYSVTYGDNTNYLNHQYKGLNIYKYGGDLPSYNNKSGIYDFGGILPDEYNFARLQYNSTHRAEEHLGSVPEMALPEKRGDITFADDGVVNHIVNEADNVTTANMIKLHFAFWFEGWDSDCFEAINDVPVSVNLSFSTKDPNEV